MKYLFRKASWVILILFFLSHAAAVSEVYLNDIERPQGAILFIVDGFGSSYYYPGMTPYALDGSELSKAATGNLSFGTLIFDIQTPYPVTGIAHSIIITGYSEANEEIAGYHDATIYDITRQNGFVNLAVMEKGDFANLREEQDIILYAEDNSIDEPLLSIQAKAPPQGVYELMYDWKMKMPEYIDNKSGREKYSSYNKWAIDAANAVTLFMVRNHPSQKFLLTVNVGAIDSGGHNLGEDDYAGLIEDLDRDFYPLYKTVHENNIALFLTADHGMSFAVKNARRGGHITKKYSTRQESLRIPLVIKSPNVAHGVVNGEYGQEDIAPTLLSVLDLPDYLQYSDGIPINVKKYASIFLKSETEYEISLWDKGQKIMERSAKELILAGLPLNSSYTLKASGQGVSHEEQLFLDSDKQFNFNMDQQKSGFSKKKLIAVIMILFVNIAGLMIINRIKD